MLSVGTDLLAITATCPKAPPTRHRVRIVEARGVFIIKLEKNRGSNRVEIPVALLQESQEPVINFQLYSRILPFECDSVIQIESQAYIRNFNVHIDQP